MAGRRRKLGFAIACGAIFLAACAAAGELWCRSRAARERPESVLTLAAAGADGRRARTRVPGLDYLYRPDPAAVASGFVNAWGFRGPLPSRPKRPGVIRVAVVGDSMTFGAAVPEPGETFPGVLGRELGDGDGTKRGLGGRVVEVLNLGVEGYQAAQIHALVTQVLLRELEPDVVVYAFYANDVAVTELSDYLHAERFPAGCTVNDEPPGPEFLAKSHPGDQLRFWLRSHSALVAELRFRASIFGYEWLPVLLSQRSSCAEWGLFTLAVRDMARQSVATGARFALFRVPLLGRLGDEPDPKIAFLRRLADAEPRFPFLDAEPAIEERLSREGVGPAALVVSATDEHPSALAHRWLGEILAEWLPREELALGALEQRAPQR